MSHQHASTSKDWPGLAATLAGFDDGRLAGLLALRPELAHPAPRDLPALASRAGAWPSARDCYLALDRAGQHVIEALCLLPQPAHLTDLAVLLEVPVDDADLEAALSRLEDRALAFRLAGPASPGAQVRLLPALRQVDYPARLGPTLASMLGSLTGPGLDQMARRLGLKPARVMAETAASIADALTDPAIVVRLVELGPDGTAELARRVAVDGPLINVQHGLYGVTDQTPAGWMVNRGLLGVADYYTAVMPREPAIALRGGRVFPPSCLRRPELPLATVDADAVDRVAAERAMKMVADVVAIGDHWSSEPPTVLKAGGIGTREVRRAAKALGRTETEAARVIELTAVAGLAEVDLLAGTALPTAAYDEWLALESPDRWAWLATSWLGAELHLSLAGAISTKGKPIPPLLVRAPERDAARRRRLVTTVLEDAPPGTAAGRKAVRDRVDWDSPGAWAGGPATAPTLVSWALDEAELLGITALGSLATAGRAILGDSPRDAASSLAGLVPPAVATFVVQADLTAVIAGAPAAAVRVELDLLADVESQGAATVYRFSEASMRRAFDAGRTTDDILAFLEGHATRGVPQPLAYLVADLGRRFGNVRVGAVTSYLRSDDPALLAEVRQARLTARLRLRPIAPTVLVTDVDAGTVTATLQAAGYLPAREAADGSLLLARPTARRAATRSFGARRPAFEPDLPTIVADLRRTPLPAAAPPAAPVDPESLRWLQATLSGAERPTEIVKGSRSVRSLLDVACEEFWIVRLSYVHSNGHASEITVEPTDIDARNLYATCFPRGDERRFVVDRIEWVRVLTEAEEELL